jgi:hypothetical protein
MHIEELYYIYYLPNAHGINKPKVGMTGGAIWHRISRNKRDGKTTDGWIILYATFSLHDALRSELEYQIHYGCVEAKPVRYNPKRRQLPMTPEERRANMEIVNAAINPIVTCPHCGKSGGRTGMITWHFDHCATLTGHRRTFN